MSFNSFLSLEFKLNLLRRAGLCLLLSLTQAYANPLKSPDAQTIAKAQALVARMKASDRGPYKHLRWHCMDGTTHPPKSYACRDHGGGHQYAAYSDERAQLAQLGWSVGTIFTALSFEEFWDAGRRHQRMRELALEQYLVDIDDGWVLRKARNYRGRVQIEDEENYGRELLLQALQNPLWVSENFLLVYELIRVVPHGSGNDISRNVRRSAQEIAELDNSFEPLRVEIHTTPSSRTIQRVEGWLKKSKARSGTPEDILQRAELLLQNMQFLYGSEGRVQRLEELRKTLARHQVYQPLSTLMKNEMDEPERVRLNRLSMLLYKMRKLIQGNITPSQRLTLLDGAHDLETEIRLLALSLLQNASMTRGQWLKTAEVLAYASYGVGLLSEGELAVIHQAVLSVDDAEKISTQQYNEVTRTLNLIGNWTIGTVRYHFAEPLVRYTALDGRAASFVDDILRGSVVLQLAEVAKRLGYDAQQSAGLQKVMFDQPSPALMALNPGIAQGKLKILSDKELEDTSHLQRDDIVVLPQTVSELAPVAGVLTMGEGNVLSHVQMLARNFGIPNVTITPKQFDILQQYQGREVVLVAGGDGSVVLQLADTLKPNQQQIFQQAKTTGAVKLVIPKVNLSSDAPLPLRHINKSLSGKVVGPKAANLGELNRLFPGRVSPAIGIPFGVFAQHVNQAKDSQWTELHDQYAKLASGQFNAGELSQALEVLRLKVAALTLNKETVEALELLMLREFGPGGHGVFIRSDTNAEDLPGFTGAGLYETLPNVVGFEKITSLIPQVWSSILSPRAIAWREGLLQNPDYVFPSVLLMKSMPVEKSGVMVTRDLIHRREGLTVSTAWGAGGAVAGEASETLILSPDNAVTLVSEAKVAWQRALPESGGVLWMPAKDGAVLTDGEMKQLRALAVEVNQKYEAQFDDKNQALPWDIEFGFIDGELTLFQIRPLIEHKVGKADAFLHTVNIEGERKKTLVKADIVLSELPLRP
ncbi:Prodigiosin synthesizing transferase PigC [Thalassocella blandensis]|nr:Prodigiosin synthesizing transferase PigC [Thalassocella blandensis]